MTETASFASPETAETTPLGFDPRESNALATGNLAMDYPPRTESEALARADSGSMEYSLEHKIDSLAREVLTRHYKTEMWSADNPVNANLLAMARDAGDIYQVCAHIALLRPSKDRDKLYTPFALGPVAEFRTVAARFNHHFCGPDGADCFMLPKKSVGQRFPRLKKIRAKKDSFKKARKLAAAICRGCDKFTYSDYGIRKSLSFLIWLHAAVAALQETIAWIDFELYLEGDM